VTAARGIKAVRAFHDAPAEIAAACDDVDFLEIILANVSGKQPPAVAIEREAPRVAQTERPDLRQPVRARGEGIVAGNAALSIETVIAVHIDAQDFPQQSLRALAVVERIAGRAAVAKGDVEKTIRAKSKLAAIVVIERLVHGEQNPLG